MMGSGTGVTPRPFDGHEQPTTLETFTQSRWMPTSARIEVAYPTTTHQLMEPALGMARSASSAGKGILIGMLSAFGSALLIVIIIVLVYLLRNTTRGRILLDRMGRPGEYDDEQAFAKEEAEALDEMDDIQRAEYLRAKAYVQANPPESAQTDISLSQFLAIQEKGVSAWEFEPELEIANCFVEGRTEIEFFDSECSVQSNLPVPKQNDVYYWEAKIYDKPDATVVGIGMTTKPYPLFRMPGYHKTSIAYLSPGVRRFNQPFQPTPAYGPPYVRGDVIGCGYRPRTGTVFFTRNGKKLDDVTHTLKTQNLFPTVGATGPCTVHVNFGQMGFVFIEANVKRWGLAPMTGSLAPPPPYGSEQGSILLEGGQHGVQEGQGWMGAWGARSRSTTMRTGRHQVRSPGPQRSPTDISLAQLSLIDSAEDQIIDDTDDAGEGASSAMARSLLEAGAPMTAAEALRLVQAENEAPPPGYESPEDEHQGMLFGGSARGSEHDDRAYDEDAASTSTSTPRPGTAFRDRRDEDDERIGLLSHDGATQDEGAGEGGRRERSPPIPTYDAAVGSVGGSGHER